MLDVVKEALKIILDNNENNLYLIKTEFFEDYYRLCRHLRGRGDFYLSMPDENFTSFEDLYNFTDETFPFILTALKKKSVIILYEQFIQIATIFDISRMKNNIVIIDNNYYRYRRLPLNENKLVSKFSSSKGEAEFEYIDLFYNYDVKETTSGRHLIIEYKDGNLLDKLRYKECKLFQLENIELEFCDFANIDDVNNYPLYVAHNIEIKENNDRIYMQYEDYEFLNYISENKPKRVYIVGEKSYLSRKQNYIMVWQNIYPDTKFVLAEYKNTEEVEKDFGKYLQKYWKSSEFREYEIYDNEYCPGKVRKISQEKILKDILIQVKRAKSGKEWKDIFMVASTGAGKSLLYQLPSIILNQEGYTVIVISPLIALMKDQVEKLHEMGIYYAVYINSELSYEERQERLSGIKSGKYSLIYVSPEFIQQYSHLEHLVGDREIGLVAVDEAHCVSTWGKDFRVDYGYLGDYISQYRREQNFPIIALTATAVYSGPFDTLNEIMTLLNFKDEALIYYSNIRRKNINIDINPVNIEGDYRIEKENVTLKKIQYLVEKNKKGIVYTIYKSHANRLYSLLDSKYKDRVGIYTGSTTRRDGDELKEKFKNSKYNVIIATKAFGMGIDIKDIEFVYHHTLTGNISDYIQEIGRAARDRDIIGTAACDHDTRDFKYYRILKSISRPTNFELSLILNKLNEEYKNLPDTDKTRKQLLIPLEALSFIFNESDKSRVENKIRQSLFLIEKDLNKKYGWDVMRVYPRDEYGAYFCTVEDRERQFTKQYGKYIEEIIDKDTNTRTNKNEKLNITDVGNILRLDLKSYWEEMQPDKNFRQLKYLFFRKKLFEGYNVIPRSKFSIKLTENYDKTEEKLKFYVELIKGIIQEIKNKKRFIRRKDAEDIIKLYLKDNLENYREETYRKLAHILNDILTKDMNSTVNCHYKLIITRRDEKAGEDLITASGMTLSLNGLMTIFQNRFQGREYFEKYIIPPYMDENMYTVETMDIACVLEILELAVFSISGGTMPYVNIFINSPDKLSQFKYKNSILSSMKKRDEEEIKIMNKLIYDNKTSEDRWDLIENYFLGKEYEI